MKFMELIIVQIICGGVILALMVYTFKVYPLNASTKKLVLASMFLLLNVGLNYLSVMVPVFGVPALKLSLAMLPLMMVGIVLSPSWAFLIGLGADVIGLLLVPTSFPFLGFTLNSVLVCVLPSLWYQKSKHMNVKRINTYIFIFLACLSLTATIYILTLQNIVISKSVLEISVPMKIGLVALVLGVAILLQIILRYIQKHMKPLDLHLFTQWMFVVVMIEVLINMLLTPLWLQYMYDISWYFSFMIRILKACIMIPVQLILGYELLKAIKKVID